MYDFYQLRNFLKEYYTCMLLCVFLWDWVDLCAFMCLETQGQTEVPSMTL